MYVYSQNICQRGFLSVSYLLLIASFLALAGCGGGGSVEDSQTTPMSNAASYEAQPGAIVVLHTEEGEENSGLVSYQWSQMDGEPVLLGDERDRNANFVMPPVEDGQDLTFVVDARHSDGKMVTEMHTVTANSRRKHRHQPPVVTPQYVVFTADKDLDNRTDLYLAMLDGSAVYRLNDPLVPGGQVHEFKISPDRRYVAYRADQDSDNVTELYVAHTDGSGVSRVSGALVFGGYVQYDFAWAPDSSRVAYRANQDTDNVVELYVAYADGSGVSRVSGALVFGGDVQYDFAWAPDSSRVAYLADQNTDGLVELFVSRSDGTDNARVSGALIAGSWGVNNFAWAPDSTQVAYTAWQLTTRTPEIFTSYPDGTGNVRVSHPLPSDEDYIIGDFYWAPDSSRIAYRAYYNYYYSSGGSYYVYYAENLYTTRPDGTEATQVSVVPARYNEYRNLSSVKWAPDTSRIAYKAEQDTDNVSELYSSGPDGSSNVRVSGSLVADGNVNYDIAWSPDSSRIAYRADQLTDNVVELFTSDPIGNGNIRVSGSLVTDGYIGNFSWSPDGLYLAYEANQLSDNRRELFTATPDGSLNPRVSGPLAYNGNVAGFVWSQDGSRLVYRADQLVDEQYELFVAAPDGNTINDNISGTLTTNGDVFNFATQ